MVNNRSKDVLNKHGDGDDDAAATGVEKPIIGDGGPAEATAMILKVCREAVRKGAD